MIGGEFPIAATDIMNVGNRHSEVPGVYTYSSGRAALYQILKFLKQEKGLKRILLPDYLCSSVIVPVKALGLEHAFYPLNEQLELEADTFKPLYKEQTAVLIINYFGLKDLTSQVHAIRSIVSDAIIIEDDVQAYYEFKKPLDGVDFKFTSLRKTFAVPDGGLVKTKHSLPIAEAHNTFGQYKAAAALLKSMREGNFNDQIYLEMFEKGENLIDGELECGMSQIAEKLFAYVDEERVKVRRLNNAQYLCDRLQDMGITRVLPLTADRVPLFIPIYIKNRDAVRREMFRREIFCPVHWPLEGLELAKGRQMAESELSLIIDQRYGRKEMDEIISVLHDTI